MSIMAFYKSCSSESVTRLSGTPSVYARPSLLESAGLVRLLLETHSKRFQSTPDCHASSLLAQSSA